MDINKLKYKFRRYVCRYDIDDKAISLKLEHSYRVMDLSILLAKNIGLSDKEVEIATLVGLLHDYGRFEQWAKFHTYSDLKSIDHADLAVDKLFSDNDILEYCDNVSYYDEIYDAIKYHNKYSYPSYLSDENKVFCKIIRDADKLDIFYLLGIDYDLLFEDDKQISDEVRSKFYNNELIDRNDVKSKNDDVILNLAMVFDLEFDYSFKYIYNNKLIEKIYANIQDKGKFDAYFDYILDYIKSKI